jgi:hypothetical protein
MPKAVVEAAHRHRFSSTGAAAPLFRSRAPRNNKEIAGIIIRGSRIAPNTGFSHNAIIELRIDAGASQAFNFFADKRFCRLLVECFSGVALVIDPLVIDPGGSPSRGLLNGPASPRRTRGQCAPLGRLDRNSRRRFRMESTPPAIKTRPLCEGANGSLKKNRRITIESYAKRERSRTEYPA